MEILSKDSGNMIALRLCLDRIVPPRKDRPVIFRVPPLKTINDAPKAMGAIIGAVASGEISISEGADMSRMVESYVRAIEATDLEIRLRAIEERIKNASP